ncbi:MAG TPA: 4'-phosphopantetheinyl transferase superfamily protein [Candidatus Eisenbacteria bacterium]|nr:4'-phosphopantetheinyl transferase superfamily protein [Candidatus Eisenbacteria bacterium]
MALKRAYRAHRASLHSMSLHDIVVVRSPSGAPRIEHEPSLHCSIAHAMGWALGAVAATPVGGDLEPATRMDARLAPRFSEASEVDLLIAGGVARESAPTVLWTLKEAVLKARETGLASHPRTVRLWGRTESGWFASAPVGASGVRFWDVVTLRRGPLCLALATPSAEESP